MPRTCTICRHPHRIEIDAALRRGDPVRDVSARYDGASVGALQRHSKHLDEDRPARKPGPKSGAFRAPETVRKRAETKTEAVPTVAPTVDAIDLEGAVAVLLRLREQRDRAHETLEDLDEIRRTADNSAVRLDAIKARGTVLRELRACIDAVSRAEAAVASQRTQAVIDFGLVTRLTRMSRAELVEYCEGLVREAREARG